MSSNPEIEENQFKIAQILQIIKGAKHITGLKTSNVKNILRSKFDVNCKLKYNNLLYDSEQQFSGYTVLHLLAELHPHSILCYLDDLINNGADFLMQNNDGYTPLLLAFKRGVIINALLLAQLKTNNPTNLRCKNGMSHFHVACSTNDIDIIDFFVKTGVSVNERIQDNSPVYPGFTSLHFAMKYNRSQTVKYLLNNGASLHIKNSNGITPLHLFMMKLIENKPMEKDLELEKILLKTVYSKSLCLSNDEVLSILHINCIFKKLIFDSLLEKNIDSHVKFDSPVFPGYTILHLASHLDIQIITSLLEKGADILAKNANGVTPFDICLKKFNLDDVITIFLAEKRYQFSKLKLTDGTLLLSALIAMKTIKQLKELIKHEVKDINAHLPCKSVIWPGYTLLHLSVIFNGSALTLMSKKADFTMLNLDGFSPLHLAYRMSKSAPTKSILNFHKKKPANAIDCDNLSHLHIACAIGNIEVVELLLLQKSNVNLPTVKNIMDKSINKGSTPLHMAVQSYEINYDIINLLLSAGADFNAADENGTTPFHIILKKGSPSEKDNEKFKTLFTTVLRTDASAAITSHVATDILLKSLQIKKQPILFKLLISKFVEMKIYEKLGLTKIQVACAIGDFSMLKKELEAGANLNQCIDFKSPLWPGDTALHILFRENERFEKDIGKLLYEYGADPTLKNANNLTPIFLSSKDELYTAISLLENKFTDINPANKEGLTHFHLSCKVNNKAVVEEFLKNGVNVNMPVKYFASSDPGYTPLHFAIGRGSKNLIELLIIYGANPNIKAANGLTPKKLAEHKKEYYVIILIDFMLNKIQNDKLSLDCKFKRTVDSAFNSDYFFSEQFVVGFKRMPVNRRQVIRDLCLSNDSKNFYLHPLMLLQYNKAVERIRLLETAVIVLQTLVNIALPILCCECIFENLNNNDLKNLILTNNEKIELTPLPNNY